MPLLTIQGSNSADPFHPNSFGTGFTNYTIFTYGGDGDDFIVARLKKGAITFEGVSEIDFMAYCVGYIDTPIG